MISQSQKETVFIEREKPFLELEQVFKEVDSQKKIKVVIVKGDFGIGKTTLVENFISNIIRKNSNVIIGKAFCSPQTQQNGLVPFKDILVDLANNQSRSKVIIGFLLNFLKEIAPAWADIVTGGTTSKIKDAITRTIEFTKEKGGTKYTQDNVFAQFANVLKKISEKNTLVLFIDDLQWADETSIGLITYLSKVISDRPLLILTTYREGEIIHRSDYRDFSTCIANLVRNHVIQLELRQGLNTTNYINVRYRYNNFPPDLIKKIDQITEGHPFFLDELFSYWEQIGLIDQVHINDHVVWALKSETDLQEIIMDIPTTVTITVQNRLELMEPKLKEIVMEAAVEGPIFTAQVISNLSSIEENELFDSLMLLERNFLLIQRDSEIVNNDMILDMYRFIKKFYREYIYSEIDPGKRRLLHRKIAELLEKLYEDDAFKIASKLIYHNREARNYEKAIQYCITGAINEQMNYGWVEAEKMCNEGESLCANLKEGLDKNHLTFQLLKISAKGLYICGNVKLAYTRYREISKLIQYIDLPIEGHLEFLLDFIDACEDSNLISEANTYIKKAEEIISTNHYSGKYKNQFIVYKSWEYIRTGQNKKAVDILNNLLSEIEGDGQSEWILAKAYNSLGIASSNLSDYNASANYLMKAAKLAGKIGDRKGEVVALLNLADDLLYYGDIPQAVEINNRALELAYRIGDRDGEAYSLANKGRIELLNNNPKEALLFLSTSLGILDEIGSDWDKSFVFTDLALSYSILGDHDKALNFINIAKQYVESDPFRLAYNLRANAKIACNSGKHQEGFEIYAQVVKICEEIGDEHYKCETLSEFANELEKAGEFTKAHRIRSDASTIQKK